MSALGEKEHLKIIKARRAHIPAVVDLWKEFMDYHSRLEPSFKRGRNGHKAFKKFIESSFGSRKLQLLVATLHNRVIGYALLGILMRPAIFDDRPYGMIHDAFVREEYRRAGVGKVLLDESINWFAGKGVIDVDLFVMSKNKVGCSFWKKAGFREFVKRMRLEL
jgi:GNAT superfamily N-acetyltransferase